VLYAALDPDTVMAKMRPWVGALLTVATLGLADDVRVIDLTDHDWFLQSSFGHASPDAELTTVEMLRRWAAT
jgi:hypothetical protein